MSKERATCSLPLFLLQQLLFCLLPNPVTVDLSLPPHLCFWAGEAVLQGTVESWLYICWKQHCPELRTVCGAGKIEKRDVALAPLTSPSPKHHQEHPHTIIPTVVPKHASTSPSLTAPRYQSRTLYCLHAELTAFGRSPAG